MKVFKLLQAFLLVSLLLCQNLAAQTYPIGYNPLTPCPEQTYNPNFDWTVDKFDFWLDGQGCPTGGCYNNKNAPWVDWQSNTNLAAFQYNGDREYKPEYGWVLVKYDFGRQNAPVNHPYLILYNKFKGIMRIFTAITAVAGTHNSAVFILKFQDATKFKSAALEFNSGADYANALSEFNNQVKEIRVPNDYSFNLPYWLYADFAMAYDPCTCNYNSNLLFDVKLITSSNLQFKINGQAFQSINSTGQSVDGTQNLLDFSNNLVDAGTSYYDKADKPITLINNIFGDGTVSPFIKDFVPGAGAAFGILNFVTGAFSDTAPTQSIAFNVDMQATGTLDANFSHRPVITSIPGSQPIGRTIIPMQYDNVMGIYNVLEKPKIGVNLISIDLNRSTVEVKLLESIKYVLNPRAEIDLDKFDIYGALEIQTLPGTAGSFGTMETLSTNFYKSHSIAGATINDSTHVWRSTTYPLATLKDVVIKYRLHNT